MDEHTRVVFGNVRKWPDTQRILGQPEHQRVVAECVDVPSSRPEFPIPINEVGISENTFWVRLPTGLTPFRGELTLNLPADLRGIHMSRIEEEVEKMGRQEVKDPVRYAVMLLEAVLTTQPAQSAQVKFEGEMPLLRETPVTHKRSLESFWIGVKAKMGHGGTDTQVKYGVGIHHMTACPCTQEYNKVLFGKNGKGVPMPTHSQRTFTRLFLEEDLTEDREMLVDLQGLLTILEQALHVIQGLLKRPDEAELVLKAHIRPQFVEDVVRTVARHAMDAIGARTQGKKVSMEIETLSLESIHTHNVKAALRIGL